MYSKERKGTTNVIGGSNERIFCKKRIQQLVLDESTLGGTWDTVQEMQHNRWSATV